MKRSLGVLIAVGLIGLLAVFGTPTGSAQAPVEYVDGDTHGQSTPAYESAAFVNNTTTVFGRGDGSANIGLYDWTTDTFSLGTSDGGDVPWLGAVWHEDDGRVFFTRSTSNPLTYDPDSDSVQGECGAVEAGWGGVADPVIIGNGSVVFIPRQDEKIAVYHPDSDTCFTDGPVMPGGEATSAWATAELLPDGRVFSAPPSSNQNFVAYNVTTNTLDTLGTNSRDGFQASELLPDGRVLLSGRNSDTGLWTYDPDTDTLSFVSDPFSFGENRLGELVTLGGEAEGYIAGVGRNDDWVLFEIETEDVTVLADATEGFSDGVQAPDGGVIASPRDASTVGLLNVLDPADFLSSDASASLVGDGQAIRVTDHLLPEDIRVFTRDRGTLLDIETNMYRHDAGLELLGSREICDGEPGQNALFSVDGLALTDDSFPVSVCEEADLERPLLKLMNQDFTLHPEGSHVVLDSQNQITTMAAATGNKVAWTNATQTAAGQSDIPNTNTIVETRATTDVDIDQNTTRVLTLGPDGVFVEEDIGGTLVVHDDTITSHTAGAIGSTDDDTFVWLAGDGDTVERYDVTQGALTLNGSYTSEQTPHTVTVSPDAKYLAVIGTTGWDLVNATTMTLINETVPGDPGTDFDLREGAFDACNNHLYVVAGDAEDGGEILRYPVHQHTDCTGFGGTDSTAEDGTNEPADGTQSGDQAGDDTTTGTDGEPIDDTGTQDIQEPTHTRDEFEDLIGIDVAPMEADDYRLWVRDRGDPAGSTTRVIVYETALNQLQNRQACTGEGAYERFEPWDGLAGIGATSDAFGLIVCAHQDPDLGGGLFLLDDDALPTTSSQFDQFTLLTEDPLPSGIPVTARSLADVGFSRSSGTTDDLQVCQKSYSALVSTTPCKTLDINLIDVDISTHPDTSWIGYTTPGWGTEVVTEVGGDAILPRAGDGHTSLELYSDTIWTYTAPPGSGETERWTIDDGTMVRTNVRTVGGTSAFPLTAAISLSPEGQVLAEIGTDVVTVRRADNLDALAELDTQARGVAVSPSLEWVYTINQTTVAAWDISDAVNVAGIDAQPVGVETFQDLQDVDDDETEAPEEPVQVEEEGLFGQETMAGIAAALGTNVTGARITLAGFLIAAMALAAGVLGRDTGASTGIAAGAGAAGGTVISLGLGLLPLWIFLALVVIAGAILFSRGGRG